MSSLADALGDAFRERDQVAVEAGQVTGTAGVKVVVDMGGASPLTLPRFTWYAPTVGDTVIVLRSGVGRLVLGKVAT